MSQPVRSGADGRVVGSARLQIPTKQCQGVAKRGLEMRVPMNDVGTLTVENLVP